MEIRMYRGMEGDRQYALVELGLWAVLKRPKMLAPDAIDWEVEND